MNFHFDQLNICDKCKSTVCIVGPLVRAGHSVGVAHYTRAPAQDLAGMLRQLERLGAWLVEYAVTRRVRVTLSGHSAGSHLCALLLSSPWFRALTPAQAATFTGVVHLSGNTKVYNQTSTFDAIMNGEQYPENIDCSLAFNPQIYLSSNSLFTTVLTFGFS